MRHGKRTLVATKTLTKRTSDEKLIAQVQDIVNRAIGTTLYKRGWSAHRPKLQRQDGVVANAYIFSATIQLARNSARSFTEEHLQQQFETILDRFSRYGRSQKWKLPSSEKEQYEEEPELPEEQQEPANKEFAGADAIADNYTVSAFDGIYDRDDQITEILASLRTARESNMEVRNHILMWGPPGCGKTQTALAIVDMMGPQGCVRLDATSTTKAGMENLILELDTIPPVLILEELEKCNEANMPCLLGIMDDRGEIIKTNARTGSVRRRAPMLVIATVNNITKFKQFQEGALVDRFTVPLYFPMPSRELLHKILHREVQKIPGGKETWIKPAIDYAINIEGTYSARRIKAIMTNARDGLIDRSYQQARQRMKERHAKDKIDLKQFGLEETA